MDNDELNIFFLNVGKDVIIDSNLLLLLLIGNYNKSLIGKKWTSKYTIEDFLKLKKLISRFSRIIVTPQILSEISNLAKNQVGENFFKLFLENNIKILLDSHEEHTHKQIILENNKVFTLGITDAGIIETCKKTKNLLITEDFALSKIVESLSLPVLRFRVIIQAIE